MLGTLFAAGVGGLIGASMGGGTEVHHHHSSLGCATVDTDALARKIVREQSLAREKDIDAIRKEAYARTERSKFTCAECGKPITVDYESVGECRANKTKFEIRVSCGCRTERFETTVTSWEVCDYRTSGHGYMLLNGEDITDSPTFFHPLDMSFGDIVHDYEGRAYDKHDRDLEWFKQFRKDDIAKCVKRFYTVYDDEEHEGVKHPDEAFKEAYGKAALMPIASVAGGGFAKGAEAPLDKVPSTML